MRILFIGDIFGKPGREIVRRAVPALVEREALDFVIANVENSAAGFGVTGDIADTILGYGVDALTTGNHVWDKKEVLDYIPRQPRLLRPANFPAGVIIVDFHAEATSEKVAMGWHLDGRVTAVFGTHTHVQTADERILPRGTAYLTDAGMTGPHDSIIGVEVEAALGKFLNALPARFETASANPRLNAVLVDADEKSGLATGIERLSYSMDELTELAADERPLRSSV